MADITAATPKPIDANKPPAPVRWSGLFVAVALCAVLLVGGGVTHRLLQARIDASLGQVLKTKEPLAKLPMQLGSWRGREDPIDERIRDIFGFDDDYVSRTYTDAQRGARVNVFIGYVGRPRVKLGHRPDKCYAAHGWEQVSETPLTVKTATGREVPSILYEFAPPNTGGAALGSSMRMYVLATYMINGRYTQDPDDLNRYNSRGADLFGQHRAYLTRIQVSMPARGEREQNVAMLREFTGLIAEPTTALMPFWEP